MFKLSYTKPCEPVGVIRHKKGEHPQQLGRYTDYDNNVWDVCGIFNPGFEGGWIQACPISMLHPYYSDTSTNTYGYVRQRWEPYNLEMVE